MIDKNPRCLRCDARFNKEKDTTRRDLWNVELRGGRPLYYLCPDCETPEQNAQAEINAATLDYYWGTDGLSYGRMKGQS